MTSSALSTVDEIPLRVSTPIKRLPTTCIFRYLLQQSHPSSSAVLLSSRPDSRGSSIKRNSWPHLALFRKLCPYSACANKHASVVLLNEVGGKLKGLKQTREEANQRCETLRQI
jgi:hypothetical protein